MDLVLAKQNETKRMNHWELWFSATPLLTAVSKSILLTQDLGPAQTPTKNHQNPGFAEMKMILSHEQNQIPNVSNHFETCSPMASV